MSLAEQFIDYLFRPVRIHVLSAHESEVTQALSPWEAEITSGLEMRGEYQLTIVDASNPAAETLIKLAAREKIPVLVLVNDDEDAAHLARISLICVLAHPVTTKDFEQLFSLLRIRARYKPNAAPGRERHLSLSKPQAASS